MFGLLATRRRMAAVAFVASGTLVGWGIGPAIGVPDADGDEAHADATGVTATGALFGNEGVDLDSGVCNADYLPGTDGPDGVWSSDPDQGDDTPDESNGVCDSGIPAPPLDTVSQHAGAREKQQTADYFTNATSNANASVEPFELPTLTSINIRDITANGLQGIQTNTVLDRVTALLLGNNVAQGLVTQIVNLLNTDTAINPGDDGDPNTSDLDEALDQITLALDTAAPVSLNVGAVESYCFARDGYAQAAGTVGEIGLDVDLANFDTLELPMEGPAGVETPPNTPLLAGGLGNSADDLIDGIESLLRTNGTLGGALGPAALLLNTIQITVVDAIMDQLEPTLLTSLENALKPLVQGTLNEQFIGDPVNETPVVDDDSLPNENQADVDGDNAEIQVSGANITLFQGAEQLGIEDQATQTLRLARSHCGPNTESTTGGGGGGGDDGDGHHKKHKKHKKHHNPKVIDSGVSGGGDLGGAAISGLLAVSVIGGSAARRRLLLDR